MSPPERTPDDDWFEALSGSERHGADSNSVAQAHAVRRQFIEGESHSFEELPGNQSAQLAKLLDRLEAEGHFRDARADFVGKERSAVSRVNERARPFWLYALTSVVVVFVGLGIGFRALDIGKQDESAILRGTEGRQVRLSGDPRSDAEKLCRKLGSTAGQCKVTPISDGIRVHATVKQDEKLQLLLQSEELALDVNGGLTVDFISRQ